MLVAIDKKGSLINLAVDGIPKEKEFTCPACHQPVYLKNGQIMRPHFAHKSLQDCHFYVENESQEHLSLKAKLYQALTAHYEVQVEEFLPQLNQVADLLVEKYLALEVQCSRLPEKRLRDRTQAYRQAGYVVRWLLGEKLWLRDRLTSLHKQFLYYSENMGFHLWEVDEKKSLIRLKYMIYEDLRGQVYYLEKTRSFADDLLGFFCQPFEKQKLSYYSYPMSADLLTYIQRQLYFQNPKWLKKQESAYQVGDNLLNKSLDDFYPQIRPIESATGFCQITSDVTDFYHHFNDYYTRVEDKSQQTLYPPAFYKNLFN